MYRPVREAEERSSKCFVYVLAAIVLCFAFLLITASILRVKNPELKLTSATLNQIQISFNASSFNATLITNLSFKNPNYGGLFSYENSNMSVFYEGVKVGDEEIRSEKVKVRGTKRMNVTVNVRSDNVPIDIADLSSEINSGTLNLTCYAQFRGTIRLLNIFHKREVVEMACFMSINLTSHAIQSIHC